MPLPYHTKEWRRTSLWAPSHIHKDKKANCKSIGFTSLWENRIHTLQDITDNRGIPCLWSDGPTTLYSPCLKSTYEWLIANINTPLGWTQANKTREPFIMDNLTMKDSLLGNTKPYKLSSSSTFREYNYLCYLCINADSQVGSRFLLSGQDQKTTHISKE